MMKKRIGYFVLFLSAVLFVCPSITNASSASISATETDGNVFLVTANFTCSSDINCSYTVYLDGGPILMVSRC
jgi:hypothetical protein